MSQSTINCTIIGALTALAFHIILLMWRVRDLELGTPPKIEAVK